MIAKRDWFERRKYTGWGLGKPRKWQGWVYLATVFIPLVIFQSLPYWDTTTRVVGTAIWIAFLLADLLPLIVTLKKDEREHKIEAIAERNAAWVMILIIVIGILYEAINSTLQQKFEVNLFLIAALFGGLIAKSISNIYYERKGI